MPPASKNGDLLLRVSEVIWSNEDNFRERERDEKKDESLIF